MKGGKKMMFQEPKVEVVPVNLDEVITTSDLCEDESGGGTVCNTSRQNSQEVCGTPQYNNTYGDPSN